MIGETVGNFEIIAPLGKGGMGEVWLAQQKTVKTKAAIKLLAASISTNNDQVRRFHNEAVAVSQIPHSGIVNIFDVGIINGRAYLIMEYLEGETIASRIKRMGRLELTQLCDFGRQIASVLDATHGAGITHRDLKPDNIFLVRDAELAHGERVKVLDFGIAKLDTTIGPRMTAASASSIGTPNYMSPEQWHSLAEADWRTDAYALGCVAFEMACGRPPFVASSRVEVCAMHLGEDPPVPSSIRPGLPPPFDVLVARLLAKEPADRPTMREVAGTFTALGESVGIALTTLPPKGVVSPFATASESMQYKVTPRAGFESQTGLPKANPIAMAETPIEGTNLRDDATPVASMSLQFRSTPRAGFESQTGMPAAPGNTSEMTPDARGPRGASQGMQMKASKSRGIGLYVGIGVLVIGATIAIALVATREGSHGGESGEGSVVAGSGTGSAGSGEGSGLASGSAGSGSAGSGSGSAAVAVRKLPPLRRLKSGGVPDLDAAVDLKVCINSDGEVMSVVLANGAPPTPIVNAAVTAWLYEAADTSQCGAVSLPAHAARLAKSKPHRLTKKLFEDSLAEVNESIFECVEKQTTDGVFTINIAVSPAGAGRVAGWARGATLPTAAFKACIASVVKGIRFAPTQQGGSGSTTLEVDQIDG